MKRFETYLPFAIVGIMALYLASKAIPPSAKEGQMDLYSAGKIAVQDGGRVKPLDSVARYQLLIISGKQEYAEKMEGEDDSGPSWSPIEFGAKKQPAMRWLLSALADGRNPDSDIAKLKIVRIENPQVLDLLKLKARPGFYRYSFGEISPRFEALEHAVSVAKRRDKLKREVFDVKVLELYEHLQEYFMLLQQRSPGFIPAATPEAKWASLMDVNIQITKDHEEELFAAQKEIHKQALAILPIRLYEAGITPEILKAKLSPEDTKDFLQSKVLDIEAELRKELVKEVVEKYRPVEHPQAAALARIVKAYGQNDAAEFNTAVADYHRDFDGTVPERDRNRVKLESLFNHFSPFYLCGVMYIMIGILGLCSWLWMTEPLRRSALGLMILTFAVHSAALFARMYLQGRPPVTNLYSSAVFIGWGGIAICIGLEMYYRNSVGNVVGATMGFATMRIAYFLGGSGDSLEMMEAVLDTNWWLATHVTCVTLGYTTTFVAGLIGVIYVGMGMFTSSLDPAANKRASQMLYGVICGATFLSFTGTVLGGIWADQSWGRFWGWDAKENGAVLVVAWNLMILHARWCGLIKQRGMAVMAIAGNMVTIWSWFGTNQLGAGLHAYGFNQQLAAGCRYAWLVHLGLIFIALVPLKYWRSFADYTIKARQNSKTA